MPQIKIDPIYPPIPTGTPAPQVYKRHMKPKSPNSFSPDARFMLGVSQLGLDLAGELSETIGAVHHQVNLSTPLRLFAHRRGLSRRIYGLVRKGLMLPAQALGFAGRHVPHGENTLMTLNVQAAINGVFGDLLERQHNPLTLDAPGSNCQDGCEVTASRIHLDL